MTILILLVLSFFFYAIGDSIDANSPSTIEKVIGVSSTILFLVGSSIAAGMIAGNILTVALALGFK